MEQQAVTTAYKRLASTYDRFFGPVFEQGRQRALRKMGCQAGQHILEVGVGTGLSLPQYPDGVRVTGIDVSEPMLERARRRLNGHADRIDLAVMDAQELEYDDNSFDKVVAMYVASVVPDPDAMIREMKRVCRPGGELYIVNHFSRDRGVMAKLERVAAPLSELVGFRPLFPLQDSLAMAQLEEVEIEPVNAFGYWSLIRAVNR